MSACGVASPAGRPVILDFRNSLRSDRTLSFFDETDEPAATTRVRRPAGSGRRPPSDQQVIMVRRGIALVAILVVVIVLAVGVHSCQVSSANSALRTYNT